MSNYSKIIYQIFKRYFWGIKFPIGISIDVTHRCNLKCKHCYFLKQNYKSELSEEIFLKKIKEIKKDYPSIIHASWVGGEPLLRKSLVKKGMKLFPFNMIVTNGTMRLPKWKNCAFNISVDGTKKYYEKIRGVNFYDKVKQNANRKDISVNISCVLNKKNYKCIDGMLKEWKKTNVNGIAFDFYTPIKNSRDNLWLEYKQRDKIIKKLLKLKKKYKSFLMTPKPVLELMLSKNSREIIENCPLFKAVISIDPLGNRKLPCVMGEKSDCLKCGCIIPFFIESLIVRRQIKSFSTAKKGFT